MKRRTHQRQAVTEALERSGQVLSPMQILAWAQAEAPSLNLSTVYRQIKALHDERQIVKVELPGQPPRFETPCHDTRASRPGHHHHYFHCHQCDRVYPIHSCPGNIGRLAPKGFEVTAHDLTLHGRCADCVAGGREARPTPTCACSSTTYEPSSKPESGRTGAAGGALTRRGVR